MAHTRILVPFMIILTTASVEFSNDENINDKDDDVCYNVDYNDNDLYIDAGPVVG